MPRGSTAQLLPAACPKCQEGIMRQVDGRFGPFLGCSTYPACKQTKPLPGSRGNSPRKKDAQARGLKVRLEMEDSDTVRVWSPEQDQSPLLEALAQNVTCPKVSSEVRADWRTANARARATGVYDLSSHDEVLGQLRASSAVHVLPVPDATLDFFPPTARVCVGNGRRGSTRSRVGRAHSSSPLALAAQLPAARR